MMVKNTVYFKIPYIGINMKAIVMRTYIMLPTCFYFRAKYIENIEYGLCVIHSEQKAYIKAFLGHIIIINSTIRLLRNSERSL